MNPEIHTSGSAQGGAPLRLRSVLVRPLEDHPWSAGALEADGLLVDLVGSSPVGDATAIRGRAVACLRSRHGDARKRPILVRVHALGSGEIAADLAAVMPFAPDALVLPAVVGGRDVAHLGAKLAVAETELGLADGATRIVAQPADTAAGVLALPSLPGASRRLAALAWLPESLAAALLTTGEPLRQARSMLILAASAAGVPALNWSLAEDPDACNQAVRDGFAGKLTLTPSRIPAINAAFAPRAAG